jgi:hypothetical protein
MKMDAFRVGRTKMPNIERASLRNEGKRKEGERGERTGGVRDNSP